MIKKLLFVWMLVLLISCGNLEFVLEDSDNSNRFKNKTLLLISGNKEERFTQELFSYFGNNTDNEFILIANFIENKENRIVKKNQVAEKIDYELIVDYEVFYKNQNCNIYNKKIITKFSFVPKSFGYNFGTDRSFEKLYKRSVRNNIQRFLDSVTNKSTCLE